MLKTILLAGLVLLSAAPVFIKSTAAFVPQSLIEDLSAIRPSGARLFNAPSSPIAGDSQSTIRRAQVAILSSNDGRQLQGLLYIQQGNFEAAEKVLEDLNASLPNNPEILNDLGVVYLALGEHDAPYYLKAIPQFEKAIRLSPRAPAP